jgi:enoyl-CoA hydratase/carnithine racemase
MSGSDVRATYDTISLYDEGAVLVAEISSPPMNLLGPELVRDLVSVIQRAESDDTVQVLVFTSGDPDYFVSHVDVTRIAQYRAEAAKLVGEPSIGLLFHHLSAWRHPLGRATSLGIPPARDCRGVTTGMRSIYGRHR